MVTESMTRTFGNFMPPPSPQKSSTRMRGPSSDDLADILGKSSPSPSSGVLPETLRRRNIPSEMNFRPEMKKNN